MKCFIRVGMLFIVLVTQSGLGQDGDHFISPQYDSFRTVSLKNHMLSKPQYASFQGTAFANSSVPGGRKHVALGVLFSVLVPGTGEMYTGSWLKGIIFTGVEIGLWIGYGHYSGRGKEWEDIFHKYADTHWNEEEWRDWMEQHPDYSAQTHTLPSTKTQQYYEMIGKYDQFMAGWDDYVDGGPALTANRNYYEGLRHNSNVQLKRASYCVMLAMGNRLLSAFDTVWTIRRINRQIDTQMRIGWIRGERDVLPCLAWIVHW